MTLRLILIRHAKSSWDDPFSDDHARVLNARGQASATAIGKWLAEHGYVPDLVLCSDAARAQQTANLILPALSPAPKLQLSARLYHATPDTIKGLLGKQTATTVAVVGHNPGLGMLANALVKTAPDHNRFRGYPTCATTIIDFDADAWSEIQSHTGTTVDFIVPRDLIGTTAQHGN
ncbi:MAG: SixA phosphatase family protein [Yoonia sp.]|uniref:SixA phosphatase family protein n=1 Tax=Yoonia sp. TaxID=2212373 RepID=UPI003EF980A4